MTSPSRTSPTTPPDVSPVLDVRELSVSFKTESGMVSAVDRVDLTLAPGEIVGIVGESGCGKSVTAMSLTGLLPRSARVTGSAQLQGTKLIGAPESVLRAARGKNIAYIFQEPMSSLNPVLTVGRQIGEVLQVHERLSRKQARARAVDLLALVRIPSPMQRIDSYPHQLSGGMRQRVMIAMAVACGPKVLVADEPTTALDVTVQAGILDVLRELRDRLGTSILFNHPRPWCHRRHRRPRCCHVRRTRRRARHGGRAVRAAPAPLHRGTAVGLPRSRPARGHRPAAGNSWPGAGTGRPTRRMHVRRAMPGRGLPVPRVRTGADRRSRPGSPRPRPSGGVLASLRHAGFPTTGCERVSERSDVGVGQ